VKCIFDSSASVNMMTTITVFVTITTVMTTKFISRFCLSVILDLFFDFICKLHYYDDNQNLYNNYNFYDDKL
jgi:hypothetical protein